MLGQIHKTLAKEVARIKSSLSQRKQLSPQEIIHLLTEMETSLQGSFKTTLESSDKKLSEAKNQLKKKNKTHHEFKLASSKRQLEMTKEVDQLRRQSDKNQRKIRQLLKVSHNYERVQEKMEQNHLQDKGTQCELKDMKLEKIIDELQKQNILLTDKINELEQQISENEEEIDSANILIKELIMQLETNISDRETWNQTGSSQTSHRHSLDSKEESNKSDQSSDNQNQMSQQSGDCGRQATPGQDNSTIDGSNTTHRDFALPEWLEFEEPTLTFEGDQLDQIHEEEEQMWPQLIWKRLKNSLGFK